MQEFIQTTLTVRDVIAQETKTLFCICCLMISNEKQCFAFVEMRVVESNSLLFKNKLPINWAIKDLCQVFIINRRFSTRTVKPNLNYSNYIIKF